MRLQTRPVIVEVKRKRGVQDRSRSIWGDVDLSKAVSEVKAEAGKQQNDRSIDSDVAPTDLIEGQQAEGEQSMPDPQEVDSPQVVAETPAIADTPKPKAKPPRVKKEKPASTPKAAKATAKVVVPEPEPAPVRGKRKVYSKAERVKKIAQIKKLIAGGASVKNATSDAAISEQTYYQWLKTKTPAAESDDLKDLLALEEENKALKKRLAEQLRKENAELKRKLGIA